MGCRRWPTPLRGWATCSRPAGGEECDVGDRRLGRRRRRVRGDPRRGRPRRRGARGGAATWTAAPIPRSRWRRCAALYRDGGLTIAEGRPAIPTPVGRAVGGTTVINSGTCFRAPDDGARAAGGTSTGSSGPPSSTADYAEAEEMLRRAPGGPRADGPQRPAPAGGRRGARRQPRAAAPQRRRAATSAARARPAAGSTPSGPCTSPTCPRAVAAGARVRAGRRRTQGRLRARPRHRARLHGSARTAGRARSSVSARRAVVARRRRVRHARAAAALRASARRAGSSAATCASTRPAGSAPASTRRCAAGTA